MAGTLKISRFAQIKSADIQFGHLTVLVGPQATGKSLVLQTLKFALDRPNIAATLRSGGYRWPHGTRGLFETYLGEGYESGVRRKTRILYGRKKVLEGAHRSSQRSARAFYIPAQRVVTFSGGWPRRFDQYDPGDPFVVKEFSEEILGLFVRGIGSGAAPIFPNQDRLKRAIRQSIERNIFHRGLLLLKTERTKRHLILHYGDGIRRSNSTQLPFLEWSAGQREFTPLLLGLYRLLPSGHHKKDQNYDWAIIEEPEMGLHPDGISTVMLLVFELLSRGYRVALSTHAPHILDLVWAMRMLKHSRARNKARLLVEALGLPSSSALRKIASDVLRKSVRVYSLQFDENRHVVRDISSLDPFAKDTNIAGWGGLTRRASLVARAVSKGLKN